MRMMWASMYRCAVRAALRPACEGSSTRSLSGTSGSNAAPCRSRSRSPVLLRDLEAVHDVGGDVAAGAEQRSGVADLPAVEDGDVGGRPAQLDQRAAQLDLVGREHGQRRGQGLEHELAHVVARPLDALPEILRARSTGR